MKELGLWLGSGSAISFTNRCTENEKEMKIKVEINSAVNTIYSGCGCWCCCCCDFCSCRGGCYLKFKLQILFSGISINSHITGTLGSGRDPFHIWMVCMVLVKIRRTDTNRPLVSPPPARLVDFLRSSWTPLSWCHCPGLCPEWDGCISFEYAAPFVSLCVRKLSAYWFNDY